MRDKHLAISSSQVQYTRKIFGYEVTPAEYTRFGDEMQIEVVKWKPSYEELR